MVRLFKKAFPGASYLSQDIRKQKKKKIGKHLSTLADSVNSSAKPTPYLLHYTCYLLLSKNPAADFILSK